MSNQSMQAVVQREYGPGADLNVEPMPIPDIGPDEVLIEVAAAGLDRGVWHLMMGMPYLIRILGFGFKRPKNPVPGMDLSGRVAAVGKDVTRFKVGDAVFGLGKGSYAEFAVAEEKKLAHKPSNIDFHQAAASAVSGITALQAVQDVAKVRSGQNVLVIGASGGVGSFVVQIAKAAGARVTGVARGAKADMVRSIGADEVIDYRTTDYLDGQTCYDVILDVGGLNPLKALRKALTTDGTLVIIGGEGGDRLTGGIGRNLRAMMISPMVKQRLTGMISTEHYEFMERLAKLMENGQVTPALAQTFSMNEVAEAIGKLEAGSITGKAVVVVKQSV